jgi:hypothetical protein
MDNVALIGGIVGGIVALFVVGGLIAFLVTRSQRRRESASKPNNDAALQAVSVQADAASHRNIYESFALNQTQTVYEHGDLQVH